MNEALRALLDMLVPPSADGRMPGAGDLPQVLESIAQFAATVPAVGRMLELLDAESIARCGAPFANADEASRAALLDAVSAREPDAFQQLSLATVTCYYQQDVVLERLGLEARPPFPQGYQVVSGDLTLLRPVSARGRIWRGADE